MYYLLKSNVLCKTQHTYEDFSMKIAIGALPQPRAHCMEKLFGAAKSVELPCSWSHAWQNRTRITVFWFHGVCIAAILTWSLPNIHSSENWAKVAWVNSFHPQKLCPLENLITINN